MCTAGYRTGHRTSNCSNSLPTPCRSLALWLGTFSQITEKDFLSNRYNMSGDSLADLQTRAFGEPKASQKREFVNQLENRHEYCI